MKDWNAKLKRHERGKDVRSSILYKKSMSDLAVPVWVTHPPTPNSLPDNGNSTYSTSTTPPDAKKDNTVRKTRVKFIIPSSLGGLIHKQTREIDCKTFKTGIQILPRLSPPVHPLLECRNGNDSPGNSSENSHKSLLKSSRTDPFCRSLAEASLLSSIHPAERYAENVEVYKKKYSYLKSWPGLLRLLAGLQLLFGGMVFTCVIAYIQKDSEWSNSRLHTGIYNNGPSGSSYRGPMTLLVLVIAGVSWIITFCLLVMGMTMYYRTILLDSPWWPLTEAFINVALFLFYMAAGIVHINDLNRGGLCYMTIRVNPVMANLCRIDGGQMAGTAFIFINMTMYLGSYLVCLKMWRHEAAYRERQNTEQEFQREFRQSIPVTPSKTKHISVKSEKEKSLKDEDPFVPDVHKTQVTPSTATASSHVPSMHIIADYILKYPEISRAEERENYKAVFNDQYKEYKDLHKDIISTLNKFRELEAVMEQLPRNGKSLMDQQRIQNILEVYHQKKNDPALLEKKARCAYLKAKLSHIKNRIHIYDRDTAAGKIQERHNVSPQNCWNKNT